jgi:large conductance mechanosensitive channel
MWKEFKKFVVRGNVLDLAVAVVLGAAFGKIVSSLVEEVLMPPIGLLLKGRDFSSLFIDLSGQGHASLAAAKSAGAPVIAYGMFLNAVVSFLMVAFAVFLLVRQVSRFLPGPATPVMRECPYCASAIPLRGSRCPHCTSQLAPA